MKNIVICCDGTGNEISENISNVLKLYRCLRKTDKTVPHQAVFYDPGVGTLTQPDSWHRFRANLNLVLGLATGYGLDDNVLAAYCFLVHNYKDGDQIFLFGFSRGAYTVRVLAGLVHKIGLISPEQVNLAGSGLIAYKQYSSDNPSSGRGLTARVESSDEDGPIPQDRFDQAAQFARITSTRWPTIHFVGVWDTVASVIVPRPDRGFLFSLEELAFTIGNPSVKIFRQAAAIDERRSMFRLKAWETPQTYAPSRFNTIHSGPQDIKQVWFAGVHSDVGGGYPEKDSGLSKYPLLWMIDEAVAHGLAVNPRTVNQLAWGIQRKNSPYSYVAPNVRGMLHNSLTPAWRVLEYLPKSAAYKEWPERKVRYGFYIPNGEPRPIPDGAFIHESVLMRIAEMPDYRPINLPSAYERVPLPVRAEPAAVEAARAIEVAAAQAVEAEAPRAEAPQVEAAQAVEVAAAQAEATQVEAAHVVDVPAPQVEAPQAEAAHAVELVAAQAEATQVEAAQAVEVPAAQAEATQAEAAHAVEVPAAQAEATQVEAAQVTGDSTYTAADSTPPATVSPRREEP